MFCFVFLFLASLTFVLFCFRILGLLGVDVAKEVKKPEEGLVEDQNDNSAVPC